MVTKCRLQKDYEKLEQEFTDHKSASSFELTKLVTKLEEVVKERDKLRGQLSRTREAHDAVHRQLYPPTLPLKGSLATGPFMNTSS